MTTEQRFQAPVYSVFWILRRERNGDHLAINPTGEELAEVLTSNIDVHLRGAYSLAGLRPDADAILWLISPNLDALQDTWINLKHTTLGRQLEPVNIYLGMSGPSQYVADHLPAFSRGATPCKYLSVYPFVKTHDWYLLSYEERQRLMREHGELGREYPSILTNTISSYGLGDQEFVVAIEGDDPNEILRMMRHLRGAEVRKFTVYDTPIYLGRRRELPEVLAELS